MEDRNIKRLKILVIFLLFVAVITAAIYFIFKTEPNCTDKIKNQGEKEVDCGGPCFPCPEKPVLKELQMISGELVHDTQNKYDIVVKIKNPNELYGASRFGFQMKVMGGNKDLLVATPVQTSFILPAAEKYLLVQSIELPSEPTEVKVDITDPVWEKFTDYEEPDLQINNKNFKILTGGAVGYAQASGTLVNNSQYDFEAITVKIVLKDSDGKILAVNSQIMNTVGSKEQRDFIMNFPHSFAGQVVNIDVEPEVNVFRSDNYIRVKGTPDKWDEM